MKPTTDSSKPQSVVLIVDDNKNNRFLLASQLRMERYATLEAKDGVEALLLAAEHDPDLILLDVMMPRMNGYETCRRLKDNPVTTLIPVIMVTALREVTDRIKGIDAGADEFLSRPHVRAELMVRVRTLIRLKHTRADLQRERNSLRLLYDIGRAINAELDLDKLMSAIITQTQTAVNATKGNLMLIDENGRVVSKYLIRSGGQLEISRTVSAEVMSDGLGGWLIRNQTGCIIDDIDNDDRWKHLPDDMNSGGAAIGVPLISLKRIVGILILNHPQLAYFKPEDLVLLETMGTTVAAAIENASLFQEISEERRKMEAVLTQSTDAIITTDEEWRIDLCNRAAEKMFDIDGAAVRGELLMSVVMLSGVAQLSALSSLEQLNGRFVPVELQLDNGTTLYITVSSIRDVGYAILMQDVTEFKRIEAVRLAQEQREKAAVRETFTRYMGPKVVDHVLSHEPGLLGRLEQRHAIVMFADLRNWTGGMISKVSPAEAVEQLNAYFTRMMEIAVANDGTVFELTGDELLVGFNAPLDQPNAHYLALKTAVEMQDAFAALRQQWYTDSGMELGLGIGIDEGDVVMGNVGAESRLSFRMVGTAMNTAHRLVDLAEDGHIVVSEKMRDGLLAEVPAWATSLHFNERLNVKLKGIAEPQHLYYLETKRPLLR